MKHILVVGSINADMVIQTERMPLMGETIRGGGFCVNPGGKGANQAAALAKLGGCVKMMGCVGNDMYGDMMRQSLTQYGVQTDGVQTVSAVSTGVAVITVCGGDNCIILDAGANGCITKESIDQNRALFAWADYCVLQLEIPLDTVVYAAQTAKQNGAYVILNPAPMCPLPDALLAATDLFVPNLSEAQLFLGHEINGLDGAKAAIGEIRARGIRDVIITLGGDGCVYSDGADILHHGIVEATVVDTTAAGDTFTAGVTVCLSEGKSMREAVRFATYASALCVGRNGAMASVPVRAEVEAFLASASNQ